jgi:tRNA (guanine37-N1)-methyltransferase
METRLKRLPAIFVQTRKTQRTLELLRAMKLKCGGFRLQRNAEVVGVPLVRSPAAQEESVLRREIGDLELREAMFEPVVARPKNLLEVVGSIVPSDLISKLPRSFDIIGGIAIIELAPELEPYSLEVGKGILRINPHTRLVVKRAGDVTGVFRTRELQVIAGTGGMETVHRESGCCFHLDVSSVYFNPRLAYERQRVAQHVAEGEVVVDMFAGVGPYSILIAKLQPNSKVYAVDLNPSAVKYLKENVLANEVADRVTPVQGDARELSRSALHGIADRVIMNLPSEAEHYVDAALHILKCAGGHIHFYRFTERDINLNSVKEQFKKSVSAQERSVLSFDYCDIVREISPSRVQVAVDAFIK